MHPNSPTSPSGKAPSGDSAITPRVTVIMNCLNGEAYLRAAIDSVFAQTFTDWEIVFWDNGSTDGTAAIARSYGDRVRYFHQAVTVPLGEARNLAIAQARGRYVAYLDADDIWLPGRLAVQVPLLDARPDCALVYGNFFYLREDASRALALRGRQPEGRVFERFLRRYPVGLLTVLLRLDALKGLTSLFDPTLHVAEEYDLFMRLLYFHEAAYVDEPLALYRIHPAMATVTQSDRRAGEFYRALDTLRALDATAGGRYAREFDRAAATVEYERAKLCLTAGALSEARRHIAPFKWEGAKPFAVYLVTFFPARLWFAFRPLWARGTFR